MNNNTNEDNISCIKNISWHIINENGHIKECFNKQAAIYVYIRTSKETPRCYVGSSINLANRLSGHRSRVVSWSKSNYIGGSPIFYNSVLKYGWNNFKFGVLEYINLSNKKDVNKSILLEREQYYLNIINPSLNICKTAVDSPLGVKRNAIFSFNLSKAKRGKKFKSNIEVNDIPRVITLATQLKKPERNKSVSVKIYDKSNSLIYEFPTIKSAAKHFGLDPCTIGDIYRTGISYDDYIYKFKVINLRVHVYDSNHNLINILDNLTKASVFYNIPLTTMHRYIKSGKIYKKLFYFCVK